MRESNLHNRAVTVIMSIVCFRSNFGLNMDCHTVLITHQKKVFFGFEIFPLRQMTTSQFPSLLVI